MTSLNPRRNLIFTVMVIVIALFGCDSNSNRTTTPPEQEQNLTSDIPIAMTIHFEGKSDVVLTTIGQPSSSLLISPSGRFGLPSLHPFMRWVAFKNFDTGNQHLYNITADTSGIAGGIYVVSDFDPDVIVMNNDYPVVWSSPESENNLYYTTPLLEPIEGRPRRGGSFRHLDLNLGYENQVSSKMFIPLSRFRDRRIVGLGTGSLSLYGLVIWDFSKSYLGQINNPNLFLNFGEPQNDLAIEAADWSEDEELFVLSKNSREKSTWSRSLILTGETDSFFQQLTSGEFRDVNSRWTPHGTIIFLRYESNVDWELNQNGKILEIDPATLKITELLSAGDFPGSLGLGSFDL